MPTLSDKPRQGNRKTSKPIPTPTPTEPPPEAGQVQPEGRIPAAILKGRKLAYRNMNGDLTTLNRVSDVAGDLVSKLAAIAFILDHTFENEMAKLPLERQAVLMFITASLRDEEEKLYSIWPECPPLDSDWFYIVQDPEVTNEE